MKLGGSFLSIGVRMSPPVLAADNQTVCPLRIISLNAWGGALHDRLLPYLTKEMPAVLCLQEVIQSPEPDRAWLSYRDGNHVLPQRANLFGEVARALPEHLAFFCPAAQGVLWDGHESVPARWGIATFVHQMLPIIGQAQDFVHKEYSPNGYGDHPRSRSAHALRVYDHQAGRAISIAQTHGLRDPRGKSDTIERRRQAQRVLELTAQVTRPDDLVVICGDFNIEPQSETLKLFEAAGLTELVTGRKFAGTRTSHYKKPGAFADYMFINQERAVLDFQVVREPEVSDHCPLVLEV